MSINQSLAQRRAKFALRRVKAHLAQKNYGNYRGYAQSLPATIMTSGLGQALAMELAGMSRDEGHKLLYRDVSDWLLNEGGKGWGSSNYGKNDILESIIEGSEDAYIRAQEEAMSLLLWLKKFAEAYLERPKAGEMEASL